MNKLIICLSLFITSLLITACGQTGGLYLPTSPAATSATPSQ